MSARVWPQHILRQLRTWTETPLVEVVALLSVLLLLTTAPNIWYLEKPLILLCAAGLVFRSLLLRTQYWYVIATMVGATLYFNWESSDNHKYMLCYWCLTMCCVTSLPATLQEMALARTSRLLIGLCMIWATAWKVLTPDYVSGAFFEYEFLVDGRFEYFARWFGGVTATTLADNRELEYLLKSGYLWDMNIESVALGGTRHLGPAVFVLTWWTVLIEGLIGVLFLLPNRRWTSYARNGALLLFALTTYVFATVRGFGWMLMLLGLSQCDRQDRRFRLSYIGVFLLIQLYTLPLQPALERLGHLILPKQPCCMERSDDVSNNDHPRAVVNPG